VVGALAPLGKVAEARRRWAAIMLGYTVAGAVTSALVGITLAAVGKAVLPEGQGRVLLAVVAGIVLLTGTREAGVSRIPLPQAHRQTKGVWAKTLGLPTAAVLWGLDLGLVFTSWFTFSGTWSLVGLAITSRSTVFAAVLLVAYWGGRALSVWLAPTLLPHPAATSSLLLALDRDYRPLQKIHVSALGVIAFALVLSLTSA
jgi:hypothetical protein